MQDKYVKYLTWILRDSPNAIMLLDSDGRVDYCSEKFWNLVDVKDRSAVEGLHFRELYKLFENDAFIANAEDRFRKIKEDHVFIETDTTVNFPGIGEIRSYTVQDNPLLDENDVFVGAQILYYDTTSLRQTETEELTRLMLEATPLPCSLWDAGGSLISVNLHTVHLFGFTKRLDKSLFDTLMELSPQYQADGMPTAKRIREMIRRAMKTGYEQAEWMFYTVSGEPLPVETSLVRISWQNTYRVAVYLKDLRSLKADQQKIREAEERIRTMLNATPLACSLWDDQERILDCNEAVLRMFGLSSVEEYRKYIFDLSPEFQNDGTPSQETMNRRVRAAIETGYQQFEWMHCTMNGEPLPVETTIVRIPLKKGCQVAIYARDLRSIKAQEAAARRADERMRLMLDVNPMVCIFLDAAGEVIDCNASAPVFFGIKNKEEFISHPYDWMPEYQPDGKHSLTEKLRLILETLETGNSFFEWTHHVAGEDIPTMVWLIRVEWEGKFSVAAYIRDLRAQKAAEEKAREADRHSREMEMQTLAAKAASEAKSGFLATMSHEIRTPLNAIIGLSEIELQKEIPEDIRINLEKIYNAGSNLLSIVNDILDISKIEAGNLELVPESYDISNLINDTVQLNIVRIGQKPLNFELSMDETIPVRLYGDELRVRQILNNLLSNAFKYTDRGTVALRVDWEGEKNDALLIFRVSDTGRGIRNEDLGSLFFKYAQFDTRVNHHIEGTGLGLPIAKNLVELMDGVISVESEYGKGSVFTVRIRQKIIDPTPIGKETAENIRSCRFVKKRTNRHLTRSYMPYGRVLIVDDVETNLDVGRGLMLPYGLDIDCAASGREAIEKIRAIGNDPEAKKYDVVFMDHMMPEMDGVEAVRIIRNRLGSEYARNVPIIALTANALKENEEMFLSHGFTAYITKPIDIFQLDTVLNTCVRNKQTQETLDQAKAEQMAGEGSRRSALPGIFDGFSVEGIDLMAGKERYNTVAAFFEVIRSYCTHTPALLEKIRGFSEEGLDQYTIAVHGLKGSSYGICANDAGNYAAVLETAARAGDIETIKAKNDGLVNMVGVLLSGLNKALAEIKKDEGKKGRAGAPDRVLLVKILEACKRYHLEPMEEAVTALEKYEYDSGGELVSWLRENLDNLEYDAIRDRLDNYTGPSKTAGENACLPETSEPASKSG
jgi:PAS domain S-box-containing protein